MIVETNYINKFNSNTDDCLIQNANNQPISSKKIAINIPVKRSRHDKPNSKQILINKYSIRNENCFMNESYRLFDDKKYIKRLKLIENDSINNINDKSKKLIGQQILNSQILFQHKESDNSSSQSTSSDNLSSYLNKNNKYKYVNKDSRSIRQSNRNRIKIYKKSSKKMVRKINTFNSTFASTYKSIDSFMEVERKLVDSSFLKRQSGKTSLTLNSTQMDKKPAIKFSAFFEENSKIDYLSDRSASTCSSCMQSECSRDCTYCQECFNKESIIESLESNENFLSSTPAIINDSESNKQSKITFKLKNSIEKNKKLFKKTTGFKIIQNYLISCKKSDELTKVNKNSKDLNRVIKLKENLKLKSKKRQEKKEQNLSLFPFQAQNLDNYNSFIPLTVSNDNFTNYGDFLVWYV